MNAPFEGAALFTAEKFNEHPDLNERPTSNQERGTHLEICSVCTGA